MSVYVVVWLCVSSMAVTVAVAMWLCGFMISMLLVQVVLYSPS